MRHCLALDSSSTFALKPRAWDTLFRTIRRQDTSSAYFDSDDLTTRSTARATNLLRYGWFAACLLMKVRRRTMTAALTRHTFIT